MPDAMKKALLRQITDFYLKSRDFNGLPARNVRLAPSDLKAVVTVLIQTGLVTVVFGDRHPNPHVKAFDPEPVEDQLQKLAKIGLQDACLYPSEEHLRDVIDPAAYAGKSFTLKLALGEPQLRPYFFDLTVLEFYRNDPRYHFRVDDISGYMSVSSQHSESGEMEQRDQVFLQTFGFGYDSEFNRVVVVYLWYLSELSPEHQQIWNAKRVSGKFMVHPDYHRETMGHWSEGISVFTAFCEELYHINEMCRLMGRAPLFKEDFREDRRPRFFTFLLRPTLGEFNAFVHLLDKMISENINHDFIQGEVLLEEEVQSPEGKTTVVMKGSIRLLEEWLAQQVRFPDPAPKDKMITVFKKVRRLRQKPAHAVEQDVFDQKYFKEQRELMTEAYHGIRTLRLILKNHPTTRDYAIPDALQSGRIWTY